MFTFLPNKIWSLSTLLLSGAFFCKTGYQISFLKIIQKQNCYFSNVLVETVIAVVLS